MQQAIAQRAVSRQVTNRMGDFNSILDFSPAPQARPADEVDSFKGDSG
jgi:hypothetical protein